MSEKFYYDCPITAAYMAKYQNIDFGPLIHHIFTILCTTEEIPSGLEFPVVNWLRFRPQEGDIGIHPAEPDVPYLFQFGMWRDGSGERLGDQWQNLVETISRDGKSFIYPKRVDQ